MQDADPKDRSNELEHHAESLQRLARSLIGDEHQAEDLVQDAYAAALEGGPREGSALGAWLAKVVRNRALNMRRGRTRRAEREAWSAKPEAQPGAAEALAGLDTQRKVFESLLALSESQRTVIYLRYFEGLTPTAIAARLGAPVKTVKTRLARGLAAIRATLDREVQGGRDTWLLALLPVAFPHWSKAASVAGATGAGAGAGAGVLGSLGILGGIMLKPILAAGALVLSALAIWQVVREPEQEPAQQRPVAAQVSEELLVARAALPEAALTDSSPDAQASSRTALASGVEGVASDPGLGSLRVNLRWFDGSPAAGMPLRANNRGEASGRRHYLETHTDGQGVGLLEGLAPGALFLFTGYGHSDHKREILAGVTTEVSWTLPEGLTIQGSVRDARGEPLVGAELRLTAIWRGWPCSVAVGKSGAEGRFVLQHVPDEGADLEARAKGLLPSFAYNISRSPEESPGVRRLDLVLGQPAGGIQGRVLDPSGNPVQGASVYAGPRGGWTVEDAAGKRCVQAQPAPVQSDASGHFLLPGGYPEKSPLFVIAEGYPVWQGQLQVPNPTGATREVRLQREARLEGRVTDSRGVALGGVWVKCIEEHNGRSYAQDFPVASALTDEDGKYSLGLLPAGLQSFLARDYVGSAGRQSQELECRAGETQQLDFQLDPHPLIAGHLVDLEGNPLSDWTIQGDPAGVRYGHWDRSQVQTDASGAFQLSNVGPYPLELKVRAPGEWLAPRHSQIVEPGTVGLRLKVDAGAPQTGTVSGRLVAKDGQSLAGSELVIWGESQGNAGYLVDFDAKSGAFSYASSTEGEFRLVHTRAFGLSASSAPFSIAFDADTDIGELYLELPGRVEVQVANLPPAAMSRVPLELNAPMRSSLELRLEGDRFVAEKVPEGPWTLSCRESEIFIVEELVVHSGQTTSLVTNIRPTHSLRLTIEAGPEVLGGLSVHVRGASGTSYLQRTYSQLNSNLRLNLPEERVSVELMTDSGHAATGSFDVQPNDRREHLMRLE